MKRVEVLLPPAVFDEVKDALLDIGVDSMTLSEVKHIDPGTRRREVFRGSTYVVDFALRVRMDLVVNDAIVPRIVDEVTKVLERAGTEATEVVVSEVVEVVRIPTKGSARGRGNRSGPLLRSA